MSKITNDGLTRSSTGCCIMATVGVKGSKRMQMLNVAVLSLCGLMLLAVLRHHVIDGRRCEVKKALTKSEMQSLRVAGTPAESPAAAAMNNQMGVMTQSYGPYGTPTGNMGYQPGAVGSWSGQGAANMDENATAAAANYGYMGQPCSHNMNAPCGHFCGMGLGNVAGMLGSMLANLGAQGGGPSGPNMVPGVAGNPGFNSGNVAGQNCSVVFTVVVSTKCRLLWFNDYLLNM